MKILKHTVLFKKDNSVLLFVFLIFNHLKCKVFDFWILPTINY